MVSLTEDDLEKLKSMLQSNKSENKNKTKTLWLQSCKAANDVLDLYEGSYDRKELGKKPDKEVIIKLIFNALLKSELYRVRNEEMVVAKSTTEK